MKKDPIDILHEQLYGALLAYERAFSHRQVLDDDEPSAETLGYTVLDREALESLVQDMEDHGSDFEEQLAAVWDSKLRPPEDLPPSEPTLQQPLPGLATSDTEFDDLPLLQQR